MRLKKYILQQGVAAVKEGDKIVTPEITEVSLKYGTFITNIIDFIVVAVVIFMVIKAMNNAKKKEAEAPAAPAPTPANEVLLAEIRDLLKK